MHLFIASRNRPLAQCGRESGKYRWYQNAGEWRKDVYMPLNDGHKLFMGPWVPTRKKGTRWMLSYCQPKMEMKSERRVQHVPNDACHYLCNTLYSYHNQTFVIRVATVASQKYIDENRDAWINNMATIRQVWVLKQLILLFYLFIITFKIIYVHFFSSKQI